MDDISAFERKKAITREHLHPGSTVLELGRGTGSLALSMAPFASHIQALDVSAEMLRIAEQKKRAAGVTNVTFRQGTLDPNSLDLRDQFDCVWAYSILHLVPDRKRTLQSLFERLKPGGTFIASNVCLGGTWVPYGMLIGLLRWFGKAPAVTLYDRETVLREMRDVGFVEIEEKDVGATRTVAFIVAKKPGL